MSLRTISKSCIACDILDDALDISACTDCYKDGAAMCPNANGLIAQEYFDHATNDSGADRFVHDPFRSAKPERR